MQTQQINSDTKSTEMTIPNTLDSESRLQQSYDKLFNEPQCKDHQMEDQDLQSLFGRDTEISSSSQQSKEKP